MKPETTVVSNEGELHIGMRNGHNANHLYLYDGKDEFHDTAVCTVYGVPVHCTVERCRADKSDSLATAERIRGAWNACHGLPTEALTFGAVAELVAVLKNIEEQEKKIDESPGFTITEAAVVAKYNLGPKRKNRKKKAST